jgi:hypothetical protein
MEAGFTAEQSIEAVEQQGSVAAALEYLMSNGRGELFQPTVDLGQKTSQRKEETMEWYIWHKILHTLFVLIFSYIMYVFIAKQCRG